MFIASLKINMEFVFILKRQAKFVPSIMCETIKRVMNDLCILRLSDEL